MGIFTFTFQSNVCSWMPFYYLVLGFQNSYWVIFCLMSFFCRGLKLFSLPSPSTHLWTCFQSPLNMLSETTSGRGSCLSFKGTVIQGFLVWQWVSNCKPISFLATLSKVIAKTSCWKGLTLWWEQALSSSCLVSSGLVKFLFLSLNKLSCILKLNLNLKHWRFNLFAFFINLIPGFPIFSTRHTRYVFPFQVFWDV